MTTQAEVRAARLAELPFETSASAGPKYVGGFVTAVKEIFSHRELLDLLIRRELKSRYKDSTLGFVWSLIKPLVQLLIYYVFIGQVLAQPGAFPTSPSSCSPASPCGVSTPRPSPRERLRSSRTRG